MGDEGFLIGSLLRIPSEKLDQELKKLLHERGEFSDLRPIHDPVFLHLPPEGCRLTELAERANMTRQAMSYLVEYLETHQYLERIPDPLDGRAQIIRRTEKAWQFHHLIKGLVLEVQQGWEQELGSDDMQQLLMLLRKLVHVVLRVDYQGSIADSGPRVEQKNTRE